jgi:type II secretory pathway pseudopilin PulG
MQIAPARPSASSRLDLSTRRYFAPHVRRAAFTLVELLVVIDTIFP